MHTHEHDNDSTSDGRPRSAHQPGDDMGRLHHAAAAGRVDVLGATGLLNLQRSIGNAAVANLVEEEKPSPVLDVVNSGGGQPLDSATRQDMESRLGADFSEVRVHNDSRADESARAVNAHAYTSGHNIVFQRDKFDPSSYDGKHRLAHELFHVIQQRSGPVEGTPVGGGLNLSDPSDRHERQAVEVADRAMAGSAPVTPAAAGQPVQRCADKPHTEDADEHPQSSVQRQEAGEEEEMPPA